MTFDRGRRSVCLGLVAATAATIVPGWSFGANRAPATPGRNLRVTVTDFAFVPGTVRARPGDRITWINKDIVPHTATAIDGGWGTKTLNKDDEETIIVEAGMSATFHCLFHPMMKGRLVIGT